MHSKIQSPRLLYTRIVIEISEVRCFDCRFVLERHFSVLHLGVKFGHHIAFISHGAVLSWRALWP